MSPTYFTPGVWLSGMVPNIRSSLTPLLPGTSEIYFRDGNL